MLSSKATFDHVDDLSVFQMQALHDVVKAGYVRYIGMSSCYAYQCEYYNPSVKEYTDD